MWGLCAFVCMCVYRVVVWREGEREGEDKGQEEEEAHRDTIAMSLLNVYIFSLKCDLLDLLDLLSR